MLNHWLIDLIGHVSGLSDAQLRQIEKSLPATKALIDLLNRAQPIIEQAQSLYAEAEPLIDQAKKEWQTVGPAAQILIDVISHHVNQGSSAAEAAEAVRTALDGSIESVAQDQSMDREVSRVTVFGGTGFVGRRVARHLRASGATVRIASRHPIRNEGDNLEQIAANANDEHSVEAAVLGADGVVNAISLYVEHGPDTFHWCTWKRRQGSPEGRGGPGPNGLCTCQVSAPTRAPHRPIFAAGAKARRPCGRHSRAQSLFARR